MNKKKKCRVCREERDSKARVALTSADARFQDERFATATAVFPNNDVKYDANKQRARLHAQRCTTPITWVQAKDDPSAQTLQDRPNITVDKKKWLSYHDKDCGALYGMLPLVKGMPVALTDHIS